MSGVVLNAFHSPAAAALAAAHPAPPLVASIPSPIVAGDDPAARFTAMVGEHFDFVWRLLRGLGVAPDSVDDAAQHVFLIASKKVAAIAVGSERSFLFGTAVGVAANVRRSQRSRQREVANEDYLLEVARDPNRDPEEETARREHCRMLEQILDSMPDELRVVFVLFELEGLTSIEIANMIGIPVGTAGSRLRRAREDFQARVVRLRAKNGGVS